MIKKKTLTQSNTNYYPKIRSNELTPRWTVTMPINSRNSKIGPKNLLRLKTSNPNKPKKLICLYFGSNWNQISRIWALPSRREDHEIRPLQIHEEYIQSSARYLWRRIELSKKDSISSEKNKFEWKKWYQFGTNLVPNQNKN